jgi:hypothetical protein
MDGERGVLSTRCIRDLFRGQVERSTHENELVCAEVAPQRRVLDLLLVPVVFQDGILQGRPLIVEVGMLGFQLVEVGKRVGDLVLLSETLGYDGVAGRQNGSGIWVDDLLFDAFVYCQEAYEVAKRLPPRRTGRLRDLVQQRANALVLDEQQVQNVVVAE